MFSGLLIILVPLIVGYLIPLRQKAALKRINQLLSWMVYLILFFMGISLAFLDNLASNLLAILHYSAVSITVILLCNIVALLWLERGLPWRNHHQQEKLPSRIAMALESLKLCGVVVIGFAIGLSGLGFLQHATVLIHEKYEKTGRTLDYLEIDGIRFGGACRPIVQILVVRP